MEVEGELSDQEALQLGVSTRTYTSPRMPKLQPIDPRSAEEPTPGESHVIDGIKSSLQRSPHTWEKQHSRRRRADNNSQPAKMGIEDRLLYIMTIVNYFTDCVCIHASTDEKDVRR